jgi:hypothetical protein
MPSPTIHLRHYSTAGMFLYVRKSESPSFEVPTEGEPAKVTICPDDTLLTEWTCVTTDSYFQTLQSGERDFHSLRQEDQKEAQRLGMAMSVATAKVVAALKFYFGEYLLNENPASGKEPDTWSANGVDWNRMPEGLTGTFSIGRKVPEFDELAKSSIQELINTGTELLPIAMRHLHRAKREANPRYRWIDATIAAELGIKEFLIRIRPEIETLILEAPSPPLPKMYGSILKSFVNEESPMKSKLDKGAQRRNKLIHRPEVHALTRDEAEEYVDQVELAILHLLTLLYPNDEFLKRFYYDKRHVRPTVIEKEAKFRPVKEAADDKPDQVAR